MFSIEDYYGCTREEYCALTGITKTDLIEHLKAEIDILTIHKDRVSQAYRDGAVSSDSEQKIREKLISALESKIRRKQEKVRDILTSN